VRLQQSTTVLVEADLVDEETENIWRTRTTAKLKINLMNG